jgi:signal transduction histidine kinase
MAPLRRRSLFRKYVVSLVGLAAFVLACIGVVDLWITFRQTKAASLHLQAERAGEIAGRIEQNFVDFERQLGWAIHASALTLDQARDEYRFILGRDPAIRSIVQLSSTGKELIRVTREGTVVSSNEDWAQRPAFVDRRTHPVWFGPLVETPRGPRMELALAHSGSPAGVTVADVDLGFVSEIAEQVTASTDMVAIVTTEDSRLVGQSAGATGRAPKGELVLVASAPIPRSGWHVTVERPSAELYRELGDLALRLGLFFGLGTLLCIAAALLLARRMIAPIAAVQAGASRIASGDFSQEIRVETGDEIELLAAEFNALAAQLRELHTGLEQKVKERTGDLDRSLRELTALEEVGRALNSSLALENVLATILTRAVELADAHGGAVYGFDRERGQFRLAATYGLDPNVGSKLGRGAPAKLDGVLAEVAAHGRTLQVPQIAEAQGFPLQTATLAAGFRSALVAPLVGQDGVVGALVVKSRMPGRVEPSRVRLIKTFAQQSALAMRNAKLFQEVEEKGRQLAIASEHKSRFFANMSHELRTPLNAILGFTELLRDGLYGELPERAKPVLERVEANGSHLLGLIDDVLDLSKLEAGELSLVLEDYSMRSVIDHVVGTSFALAHAKGLELRHEIEADLPRGRGDERRLTQVLLNIVGNAIKFTEAGHVGVVVRRSGDLFEIVVEDTGPGIAPEDIERVFEAFQQADNTSTRVKGGTGLGLSISRRFVEMHGGTIEVRSTLGTGTAFTMRIPIEVIAQKAAA